MRRHPSLPLIVLSVLLCISPLLAKAPRSKDVMAPIDTSPGSFTDTNHLLKVSLDSSVAISVVDQPAMVVYNRINGLLGIEFGYVKGVDREQLVSLNLTAPALEVLKALGRVAKVRFEAVGPMHIRVLPASGGSARKPPTEPPPVKHP